MDFRPLALGIAALGTGLFCYGMVAERRNLQVNRQTIRLRRWPESKSGYRIALLADFHVCNLDSATLAVEAIHLAIESEPDAIVIAGDFVDSWFPEVAPLIGDVLSPLARFKGLKLAGYGNHDYYKGEPIALDVICPELGITVLKNSVLRQDGIEWIGIDSFQARQHQPATQPERSDLPQIVIWHEPDAVDFLRHPGDLMLSGHSHGGQFVLPGGFEPKHSDMGRKYVRGFFPHAPTPLFVTTGVGTTFLPSRLNCPPEVAVLELVSA